MAIANVTTPTNMTPAVPAVPKVYEGDRQFYPAGPEGEAKATEVTKWIAGQTNPETNKPFNVKVYDKGEWPIGAGYAILPLARNEERTVDGEKTTKRILHAVLVWPYFGIEAVQAHKDGNEYLSQLVQEDQAARILNPTRRQPWEKDVFNIEACPQSLNDHIEGMAADRGTVKAFMDAAKVILPKLREAHPAFKQMQPPFLRQLLSSKALATSFSAGLEAKGFFVGLIGALETVTKAAGGPVDIYQQWRDTRDEQVIEALDDLDLASLSLPTA